MKAELPTNDILVHPSAVDALQRTPSFMDPRYAGSKAPENCLGYWGDFRFMPSEHGLRNDDVTSDGGWWPYLRRRLIELHNAEAA